MDNVKSKYIAAIVGMAFGALVTLPSLLIAALSAGAGHGDYGAARALFPFSMAITLVEGSIGPISLTVALAQFPIYGGVLGWSIVQKNFRAIFAFLLIHFIAMMFCFSGTLPAFS